jgi:hypothetical protein
MRFLTKNKLWLLPTLVLVPISIAALRAKPAPPLSELPPVFLWAWERPEKLDFINTEQVGIAFLAKTITLDGDRVLSKPRLQTLELAPGTKLIAVVRIESDRPTLSPAQLQNTAREIADLSLLSGISVVQIDYDATVSERQFYKELLTHVRQDLPREIPISITALASWCAGDNWLSDLPIDEAVPMLFRMGIDQRRFQSDPQFESGICRGSAGVSIDEPVTLPDVKRLYIFNPKSWTRDSLHSAMETYNR